MRTRQAMKNALMSFMLQITLAISGIIVPRFFIAVYGSSVNGLTSSINQFITYMSLVEAGIGAAGTVALYRPIAEKNQKKINEIVSAARSFYQRSGIIFLLLAAVLVFAYPYIVHNEIQDVGFIRMMIAVLCVNGIVDYFYLGKYRVLLLADQRAYILYGIQIIGTVVMTVVSIWTIRIGCSALVVKSVTAIIYLLRSIAVGIYVKCHYPKVDFHANPDMASFGQRWAALLHQIVGMIVCNTDIVLLTLFIRVKALVEVSIYSTYNLVAYALSNLINSISNGLGSGFGDVISRGEQDTLERSFSSYEYTFFILIFIAYSCMAVLLYPFIALYSADFADRGAYLSWSLVALFTLSGLVQSLRQPGLTIICAAGHYKQTQWRAVLEAIINLSVSLLLIGRFGICGVLLGTCASYLYRTTDVITYTAKHFLPGTLRRSFMRILRNAAVAGIMTVLGFRFVLPAVSSWLGLIIAAVIFGIADAAAIIGVNYLFERNEAADVIARIKGILGIKKKEKSL